MEFPEELKSKLRDLNSTYKDVIQEWLKNGSELQKNIAITVTEGSK